MTAVACIIPRGAAARPTLHLQISRQRCGTMADWQAAIVAECRRHRTLCRPVFDFLKGSGLLTRCTFLASDTPDGPLVFRHIGAPTLSVLGRAWGRAMLNQPTEDDPHTEFSASINAQYASAIAGEVVHNRIVMLGPWADGKPYTHALYGWRADDGRRAVLSAIALEA